MKELMRKECMMTEEGQKRYVFTKKEFEKGIANWLSERVGMPVLHHVGYDESSQSAYLSIFSHYDGVEDEELIQQLPYLEKEITDEADELSELLMDQIQSHFEVNLQEDYLLMEEVLTDAFGWGACAYELDENQVEVYVS